MRSRSTEITVRASSRGASRLPEMLVPPPNGITTASASSAARSTAVDRGLVARSHDDVGDAAEVAAALAHEVAQALAARVHDAVVGVVGDVAVAGRASSAARSAPSICGSGMSRSPNAGGCSARARRRRRCC